MKGNRKETLKLELRNIFNLTILEFSYNILSLAFFLVLMFPACPPFPVSVLILFIFIPIGMTNLIGYLLIALSLISKQVQTEKLQLRGKAQSFTHAKSNKPSIDCQANTMQFSALSSSADLSHQTHRRFNLEQLLEYVGEVLERVYEEDDLKVRLHCMHFIKERTGELRGKVQERLSFLKYLEESLRYKSFAEIEAEVLREWRKNALLFSLGTLWSRCMLDHKFKDSAEFAKEYNRFRTFAANLSQFYFRGSLRILNGKGIDSLSLFFEDTAHQVIGGLRDWRDLYKRLLELLGGQCSEMNLDFDLSTLKVNCHYLRPEAVENQLPQTTSLIAELADEISVHGKIALFKKIRSIFLIEITESCNRIAAELKLGRVAQFEKDDILDCMIYCIVRGQVQGVRASLQALQLLVGKNSDLLSKKGVDSYRADLQGAVQYLCEEQLSSPLIKLPKNLLSTRLTFFQQ